MKILEDIKLRIKLKLFAPSAIIGAAVLALSLGHSAGKDKGDFAIVPGDRIGPVNLAMSSRELETVMGQGKGEMAIGTGYIWWPPKSHIHYPLARYFMAVLGRDFPKGRSHIVKLIRVTSSQFTTADGISTNSTEQQIRHAFSKLILAMTYDSSEGVLNVYDDDAQGIAFQVRDKPKTPTQYCYGIMVHPVGLGVRQLLPTPDQ